MNIGSENAIIGGLLNEFGTVKDEPIKIFKRLKNKYFLDKKNQMIFRIMRKLFESGAEIDTIIVYEMLVKHNIKNISAAYLSECSQNNYTLANVDFHIAEIIENYRIHELQSLFAAYQKAIQKNEFTMNEMLFELQTKIAALQTEGETRDYFNFAEHITEIISGINDERTAAKDDAGTLKTLEFPTFNKSTGGLKPGNVVVISGSYKNGKTTYGLALLSDFVINRGKKAAIIFLEGMMTDLSQKVLSMTTATRYGYLRDPSRKRNDGEYYLTDKYLENMQYTAKQKFKDKHLFMIDGLFQESEIIAAIRELAAQGVEIFLIDYLSRIKPTIRHQGRHDLDIALISTTLTNLAIELKINIIFISQENSNGSTAESVGPLRDMDFWFSITNPYLVHEAKHQGGNAKINFNGTDYPVDSSYFVVNNKGNRHLPAGSQAVCRFMPDGTFVEIDIEISNQYEDAI